MNWKDDLPASSERGNTRCSSRQHQAERCNAATAGTRHSESMNIIADVSPSFGVISHASWLRHAP